MNRYLGWPLAAAVVLALYLGGQYGFGAVFWIFAGTVAAVALLIFGVIAGVRALLRWRGYL